MAYIHELTKWPDLYWDTEQLTVLLATVRKKQGFLLGKMSSLSFNIQQEASLEILTANIIKSSEIEGEYLDKAQVRSSVAKNLGLDIAGLPRASRHIDGMVEMMLDATQNYQKLLTLERLYSWHAALFPTLRSGLHEIMVGAWRTDEKGSMQVVSNAIGREKVHYEAPAATRLSYEMEQFLDWFNYADNIELIIKSAVSHFWFVTIHPFEDGNGRMARAIADMCLAEADGITQRFYSMSTQIEKDKKSYYEILEKCQKGSLNITLWLEWFLKCLNRALDTADKMLENIFIKVKIWDKLSQHTINDRQRKVINCILDDAVSYLTAEKYAKLVKCSHDTALRDIKKLIEYGVMQQEAAGGRSTRYSLIS